MVYAKRRIGKSTLIIEAAKDFKGVVVNFLCVQSTLEGNLSLLGQSVCDALKLPYIQFRSIIDLFTFIDSQQKSVLLIIDEYQYLKNGREKNEVDSYFQTIIDRSSDKLKLVLCGSYISIMKELMEEENPLFGRFTLVIHLEEFNCFDASAFFSNISVNNKIAYYSVFGGSPYVLSCLKKERSLEENIRDLLLPETGLLRIYIENVVLKEIQKVFDTRILEILGNGKKKYSQILTGLALNNNGSLDKQLGNLLQMETINKTSPINKAGDKKKQFYQIQDNLLRFYFVYLFGKSGQVNVIGEKEYYHRYIEPSITEFISQRFKNIGMQYFQRKVKVGKLSGVYDIGSYWFDDPKNKTNGEFDCVLKLKDSYRFYECKYYQNKMTLGECQNEGKQVKAIKELESETIGFICSAGFDFTSKKYDLIDGEDLFNKI